MSALAENHATLSEARAAKAQVLQRMRGTGASVGITRMGDGYGVKVNVATRQGAAGVPRAIDGVPVRVEVVGTVQKQVAT